MLELTQRANVEQFIKTNIGALEEILNQTAQKYLAMQKEKGKYDFGQNLTPERLKNLADEVIRDTNGFLGISYTSPANLSTLCLPREIKINDVAKYALGASAFVALTKSFDGFTGSDLRTAAIAGVLFGVGTWVYMNQPMNQLYMDQFYHSTSKLDAQRKFMMISENKEVTAVGEIAHEYTHLLQNSFTDLLLEKRNPIAEGHARGVEGAVASIFAQRYGNPAYLFYPTKSTAQELKDAYLLICGENGISPRKPLVSLPIPDIRGQKYKFPGHHHSIGAAAMSIAQSQHGDKVYRRVMNNDFLFLKV